MKDVWLIILGLVVAFVGQFVALGVAGGGHGWVTPFWTSILLWIAYPVVLLRARRAFFAKRPSLKIEVSVLLGALAADAALMLLSVQEGVQYFWYVLRVGGGPIIAIWLAIWCGWQIVAAANSLKLKSR